MYKTAQQLKLRFTTPKGNLSTEQLFDLNMSDLSVSIKVVKKILKKNDDDELSFLEDSKTVDVENQLRFDILKDVYLTKKRENEEARLAIEKKVRKQKILQLIADKKDESLKNMSVEELEKMLDE
jgi:DNA-binding transcriptional MerR regulator